MNKESLIYVGCALTQASQEFKEEVEEYKRSLRDVGYEVLNFIGLEKGTDVDVYRWDIKHCVRTCDIFVGICDYPSIGLGVELNEATRLGKEVLAVAHTESEVTRLILGAAKDEPNIHFARYTSLSDTLPLIEDLLHPGNT